MPKLTSPTSSLRLPPNQQPRRLQQTRRQPRRRRQQAQALLRLQRGKSRARRVHAVLHLQGPAGGVHGLRQQVQELHEGLWV